MTITTIGIDLAKNVFAVHGVDHAGKTVLVKPRVPRAALPELITSLPPCVIGMEACSGAHYWARLFRTYGHEPRLMAPKFVSPYRMAGKSGKNDAADAQAICEAVLRPQMRFVPVKDEGQQAMLCLHRTRQGFMEEKTAIYNRIRGLISEFGVIGPQSTQALRHMVHEHKTTLPEQAQLCVGDLLEHIDRLEAKITEYDRLLTQTARKAPRSQQLMKLKGIGPTTASALVASIGNGFDFKNGRQMAAWLGLTPSQYSSGGKSGSVALRDRARESLRRLFFRQSSDRTALTGTNRPLQDVDIALCLSSLQPRYQPIPLGLVGMT